MKNLLKDSSKVIKAKPENTDVCIGCKQTLDINVNPLSGMGDWKPCRFCGKIRLCLLYFIECIKFVVGMPII